MLNDWNVIGNLGKDPESHTAKSGAAFVTFSMALNKPGAAKEDKPMWVNVTAFGKTGEYVINWVKKGHLVHVSGPLEVQEYEGNDGKNHVSVKLLANRILKLTKSETSEGTPVAARVATSTTKTATAVIDEDIPF